jgi:hypothetical protein
MIGWIVAGLLALMLIREIRAGIKRRTQMADYVLMLFSDEHYYQEARAGLKVTLESANQDLLRQHLWLHSNTWICSFLKEWGNTHPTSIAAEEMLRNWIKVK